MLLAEKGSERIAVEIKGFAQPSFVYALHEALGQFLSYVVALEKAGEARDLYLAMPEEDYTRLRKSELANTSIKRYGLRLLIFDDQSPSITQWIK